MARISDEEIRSLKQGDFVVYVTTTEGPTRRYEAKVWQHQGHRLRLQIPGANPSELLWSFDTNQPTGSKGYAGGEVWLEWPSKN